MRQKWIEYKEWIALAVMMMVIIFLGTYRLTEAGQPIMNPDEIGYWANSSFFMGIDWSSATNNMYYYSYGYSLLLIPIRLLAKFLSWDWRQKYEAMIIVQSCIMLTGTFLTAVRLCKRYMPDFHWLVRDFACLMVVLYPSYIVYAHMTCAETTLLFLFWVYLYLLMRLTDHPTTGNHMGFAFISFYIYMVHQRTLPIIIASTMIIVAMRILRMNKLLHAYSFLIILFLCNIVHSAIKGKLKNDFYMANDPAGLQQIMGYILNRVNLILLLAGVFVMLCMWFAQHRQGRIAIILTILIAVIGTGYVITNFKAMEEAASNVSWHMSGNDFAGQLWHIRDVFTIQGFLRLLISIVGKWFYLATASGLLICFGIWHMGIYFVKTSVKGIKEMAYLWKKEDKDINCNRTAVWFWGAFLGWLGIFSISALAISGIGRVDNLIYGRYHEFTAGILILYGFYSLVKDTKWKQHLAIFVILYLLAAGMCQYILDELGNSVFAVNHSLMMGFFLHDGEVPNGGIWSAAAYAVPIGVLLCAVIKIVQTRFTKTTPYYMLAALSASIGIYVYMGMALVQNYVIYVNNIYEERMPAIAMEIDRRWQGEHIYFMDNGRYYLWGLELQYYLDDKVVTIRNKYDIPDVENAFYIVLTKDIENIEFFSQCERIIDSGGFTFLVHIL